MNLEENQGMPKIARKYVMTRGSMVEMSVIDTEGYFIESAFVNTNNNNLSNKFIEGIPPKDLVKPKWDLTQSKWIDG